MGYAALLETMGRVNDVLNAKSVLNWDARTKMPAGGSVTRAKQLATLTVLARDVLVNAATRGQFDAAEKEMAGCPSDSVERTMLSQIRDAIDYHLRIPAHLLHRRAELSSIGQDIWVTATSG